MSVKQDLSVETLVAVAAIYNVSVNTAREWSRSGMPGGKGHYHLPSIHKWWLDRELSKLKPAAQDGETTESLRNWKLRQQCITLTNKNTILMNRYVEREKAIAAINYAFHRVRGRLDCIPEEFANSLPQEMRTDAIEELKHRIRLIRTELENYKQDWDPNNG